MSEKKHHLNNFEWLDARYKTVKQDQEYPISQDDIRLMTRECLRLKKTVIPEILRSFPGIECGAWDDRIDPKIIKKLLNSQKMVRILDEILQMPYRYIKDGVLKAIYDNNVDALFDPADRGSYVPSGVKI